MAGNGKVGARVAVGRLLRVGGCGSGFSGGLLVGQRCLEWVLSGGVLQVLAGIGGEEACVEEAEGAGGEGCSPGSQGH